MLSTSLNIDVKKLIVYNKGPITERSTWAHPYVAMNIAEWISPFFSIELYKWIDEWKEQKLENKTKMIDTLNDIQNHKIYSNKNIETNIRDRLSKELNGETEVNTEFGKIDLLTKDEIVEIKHLNKWKHAFGQVLSYSKFYPNHKMRIHLFYFEDEYKDIMEIKKYLCSYNINVTSEIVENN